jgi:peptidoglycan glycosyltransferase
VSGGRGAFLADRRARELGLGLLAALVTTGGYVLLALSEAPALPADLWGFLAVVLGLFGIGHLALRRLAPLADATLLPLAALLAGLGFVTIARLDLAVSPERRLALTQAVWVGVGMAAFVGTLAGLRRVRTLERYRYSILLGGVVALLLPLVPGLGYEANGARLWIRVGTLNFQPGEAAKILLVVFFAAYLTDHREVLATGSRRLGRLSLPDARHLGPVLVPWGISILIMVNQKDLGSSLLFFAVFVAMLYMATGRGAYLLAGLLLFSAAAVFAYRNFGHVTDRVQTWLDPWADVQGRGYQLAQSLFALGEGGLTGTGLGLGRPDLIPNAATDFVLPALGEELGFAGTAAMLAAFLLLVGRAFRVAIETPRPFSQLFAAGLATILGVQTFVIVGGVTRVIPLTGVTLPFVSYGGSSLVANFVIVALLLRISDETARAALEDARRRARHLEPAAVAP